jgi:hypothetical protein
LLSDMSPRVFVSVRINAGRRRALAAIKQADASADSCRNTTRARPLYTGGSFAHHAMMNR